MKIPLPFVKRRARIEIIPLIDIIFFLLATFVMVSLSMVKNQGIAINLPKASTSAAQDISHIVTVTITENSDIYIDKDKYSSVEEASAQLKARKAADPEIKVLINGDDNASFGRAIAVLDEARKLGILKVSIRTKRASNK
jgi:biopolymer transport protein ExbD